MTEAIFYVCLWFGLFKDIQCSDYGIPVIKYATGRELARMHYGKGFDAFSDDTKTTLSTNIGAVYNSSNNTIYLSDTTQIDTIGGQSVLVHEMVHHMQLLNGKYQLAPCINALEAEAYTIQNEFLVQHGYKPHLDEFSIKIYSQCGV